MKTPCRIGVLCASSCLLGLCLSTADAAGVSGQGTWETTLLPRDLDGNLSTAEAYYDTALNITWLADANAARGTPYDDGYAFGDGAMTWTNANAWAASLNFNGVIGWRLPTATDTGNTGCDYAYSGTDCGYNVDPSTSELAHMFYTTLGDLAEYDSTGNSRQNGYGLSNTGPFSNIQPVDYWSATDYVPDNRFVWVFNFGDGQQWTRGKADDLWAWAVHPGDIGATVVPVPAPVWLFSSGLLGLLAISRRKITV